MISDEISMSILTNPNTQIAEGIFRSVENRSMAMAVLLLLLLMFERSVTPCTDAPLFQDQALQICEPHSGVPFDADIL